MHPQERRSGQLIPLETAIAAAKGTHGGYLKCKNLSEGARRRMTKMVDAGHFDSFPPEVKGKVEAKPTKKNLRKGTALVAVEDDSESEGDDDQSALPSLEELLRKQGFIHLNVGAVVFHSY